MTLSWEVHRAIVAIVFPFMRQIIGIFQQDLIYYLFYPFIMILDMNSRVLIASQILEKD
jgi:hypothetical protein